MCSEEEKITEYIQNKHPVEIFYTDETGEMLWAIRVKGTDFWLDGHKSLKDAVKACKAWGLPYEVLK